MHDYSEKELDLFAELLDQDPLFIIMECGRIYAIFTADKKESHKDFLNYPNVELNYVYPNSYRHINP